MATPNNGGGLVLADEARSDPGGPNVTHIYNGTVHINNVERVENGSFAENNGNFVQGKVAIGIPSVSLAPESHGLEVQRQETPIQRQLMLTGPQSEIDALLNPIFDASYTRNRQLSPPDSACFPGTRQKVIGVVRSWMKSSLLFNDNPHVLWIYGYAGCGKSAIAQSVAELFAGKGQLAASFFFFRGSGDRSTIARFATTVASQVASAIPATAPHIKEALMKNGGLRRADTATLIAQFQHLVFQPIAAITWDRMSASLRGRPFLIVFDGLDECEDRDEVAALVRHMLDFFARKPRTPLRFLITSRVESHIHQCLHSSSQVRLLDLVDHTSDSDIAAALDAALDAEKGNRVLACDRSWPSAEEKAKLVKHIGGSYIFMTTIVKLLFDPHAMNRLTPMERLPLLLSTQPDFDGLYRAILEPSKGLPHFHNIISAIARAQEPLSIIQIADLLNIKAAKVVNVLVTLHAIMQVPGDDQTPVTLWHTSLRDFLCTKSRSGTLFANFRSLAYACLASIHCSTTADPSSNSGHSYSRRFVSFHWTQYIRTSRTGETGDPTFEREITSFLKIYSKEGYTPLESAVRSESWNVVHALINVNVDVNVQFHRSKCDIVCALHAACYCGQWDLANLLLDKGADPNFVSPNTGLSGFNHGTPLAFAARKGDVQLATRLLECGADPNLQGGVWGTALRAACAEGSLEVVKLLLDHGANPNLGDGNRSPLHSCAWHGHQDCARALLMRNADPNPQDNDGDTPLHDACHEGHTSVVECLLEFKADASIKNHRGQTALQVPQESWRDRKNIIEVFRRHGIVE